MIDMNRNQMPYKNNLEYKTSLNKTEAIKNDVIKESMESDNFSIKPPSKFTHDKFIQSNIFENIFDPI